MAHGTLMENQCDFRAMFKLAEKGNHDAVHGTFDSQERAQKHLREVIPEYCRLGYFMNKSLIPNDFEVLSE